MVPYFSIFLKVLIWAISWALKGALPLIFFSYCQTYSIFSKSEKWKRIFQTIRPIPFSRHVRSGVGCSAKNYALPWIVRRREEQAEEIPLTGVQKCAYDTWVIGHAMRSDCLCKSVMNVDDCFFPAELNPRPRTGGISESSSITRHQSRRRQTLALALEQLNALLLLACRLTRYCTYRQCQKEGAGRRAKKNYNGRRKSEER